MNSQLHRFHAIAQDKKKRESLDSQTRGTRDGNNILTAFQSMDRFMGL
jgi:hypothetical protein